MKNMEDIVMMPLGKSTQVALAGVSIKSRVSGTIQETSIRQTFVNTEPEAIEAVYTFPLPENAAVSGFDVSVDGRVLTGVVEAADEALEQYEEAVAIGDGAYLLDSNRPDVFTVNVGNLNAGQEAVIGIRYVAELTVVDGAIRFEYPTCVAPRYVSATGSRKNALGVHADGDAMNPPHLQHVPYGMSFELLIDSQLAIKSVDSPSHALLSERTAEGLCVKLGSGDVAMDRSVVIGATLSEEQEPSALLCADAGIDGQFIAVTFVPELDPEAPDLANEVVFVVDCSGSMGGASIEQAKRALGLCLRTMSEGDYFNICRFGSNHEFMAKRAVPYSEQSLRDALHYVNGMRANMGGTEILTPLKSVFQGTLAEGLSRQVVLLTDGQVSNEAEVIALASKHADRNRIFSFAIGAAASNYLVGECARLTGGVAEFIANNERIESKVLRTFSRMASPCIESVDLEWSDGALDMADSRLGPIFDGEALTLLARATGALPKAVSLRAKTRDQSYHWQLDIPTTPVAGCPASKLWARRRIRELESRRLHSDHKRVKQQIVSVSKRYGIASTLTSYIVVEHRSVKDRNQGIPALRRIPVNLPEGWGGRVPGSYDLDIMYSACATSLAGGGMPRAKHRSIKRSVSPAGGSPKTGLLGRLFGGRKDPAPGAMPSKASMPPSPAAMSIPPPAPSAPPANLAGDVENVLFELLAQQSADGHFEQAPDDVCKAVCKAIREDAEWRDHLDDSIVATVACLLILARDHGNEAALWRRAARKASKWVANQTDLSFDEVQAFIRQLKAN